MLGRRALVAVAAIVALGLSACANSPTAATKRGSNTTHLSPFQLVSSAAKKTTAAKTAHMVMTMHAGTSEGEIAMSGTGDMDFGNGDAAMTFDMSGLPGTQSSMTIDMVMSHGAIYMHMPEGLGNAGGIPGGKSWLKFDLAALAKQSGMNFPGFSGGSLGSFDPAQQLAYLQGVSRSVKDVGAETIDGAQTERYHVVLDLEKALHKLSGSAKCGLGAAMKSLGGNLTVPADVWIDDQRHLRQMKMTLGISGFTMDMQMNLSDFGAPVHVDVPSDSEVYDLTPAISSNLPGCATTSA